MRSRFAASFVLCLLLLAASARAAGPDSGQPDRLVERFLRYVRIDTQSQEDVDKTPTTAKQLTLAHLLAQELGALGVTDVQIDQFGFVTATLAAHLPPGTIARVPTLGLLAHMDTSPAVASADVKPRIIRYTGGDIVLPGNPGQVIRAADNPELAKYVGQEIITTDGTTLLGADDKAGIAEIMELLARLKEHPEIHHPKLRIAFTVDEETSTGIEQFDIARFAADYAYTVDGGTLGEIENETFNADQAVLSVTGVSTHPGTAKSKMVNSVRILADFITHLPAHISPENTEKREGYLHPYLGALETGESSVKILMRDFDLEGLAAKEKILEQIRDDLAYRYPRARIHLEIKPQYRNMRYQLDKAPFLIDYAREAARRAGLEPRLTAIRGGTDGANLTARGLLTPNLFTGGENFHSQREWIPVPAMHKAVDTLVNLVQIWVEKPAGRPAEKR